MKLEFEFRSQISSFHFLPSSLDCNPALVSFANDFFKALLLFNATHFHPKPETWQHKNDTRYPAPIRYDQLSW